MSNLAVLIMFFLLVYALVKAGDIYKHYHDQARLNNKSNMEARAAGFKGLLSISMVSFGTLVVMAATMSSFPVWVALPLCLGWFFFWIWLFSRLEDSMPEKKEWKV